MNSRWQATFVFVFSLILAFQAEAQTNAFFTRNLYYGLRANSDVTKLQNFLRSEKVYFGPVTGNFYSLTLDAVKTFQRINGIIQTGYFGPLSRNRANTILGGTNNVSVKPPAPLPPTPSPISPPDPLDSPGWLKSSIGRSIATDIVVDIDSFIPSNTDLNEFFRLGNNMLVSKTDVELKLGKIRRISYTKMPQYPPCVGCNGSPETDLRIFDLVYQNETLPEYIIFLRADNTSALYGGYSTSFEAPSANFCSRFKSATGDTHRVYVDISDWGHIFSACGYDRTDPKHPVHISNIAIDGECRNKPGTACILNNSNQFVCNDAESLQSFYSRNHVFNASNVVHELMHQFGSDGNYDHFGTQKCDQLMGGTNYNDGSLNAAQRNAGICPKVFELFKNSYQACQ